MSATKLSLKLLIDRKAGKVVFAEAGKDFVDFLFNLLSLPVGSIINLLTNQNMVGCIRNVYKSVKELNASYVQPNQNKDYLLKPITPITTFTNVPLLLSDDHSSVYKYFCCGNNKNHADVSHNLKSACPSCNITMDSPVEFDALKKTESSSNVNGGFVKGLATYMVMDDLTVMPLSMIAGVSELNKCKVSGFDALEEKKVEFSIEEGLKLLQASVQTKAALTKVFLVNEKKVEFDMEEASFKKSAAAITQVVLENEKRKQSG